MLNIVDFLKEGSKIHIKESQKGSFTKYCKGKVTNECIQKGKNSPNPKIRKKAVFAQNSRKWKHKDGGKAFVNGVNVLDSNPDAYKWVKKKYKMRSAQNGTKLGQIATSIGNFLNSDTGKGITNAIGGVYQSIKQSNQLKKQQEQLNKGFKLLSNNIDPNAIGQITQQQLNSTALPEGVHVGNVDYQYQYGQNERLARQQARSNAMNWYASQQNQLMQNNTTNQTTNQTSDIGGTINTVLNLASLFKNNPTTTNTSQA